MHERCDPLAQDSAPDHFPLSHDRERRDPTRPFEAVAAVTSVPTRLTEVGCPSRGSRLGAALCHGLLRLAGWRLEGRLPAEPRFVLIVAPHTSNWDFIIGVLAMFALRLRASWLGKHSIFRFPVAGLLRWLGGEPVDRSVHRGTVGAEIDRFRSRKAWVLAISPEGTRKRVPEWKTGFYRIALGADVPVLPVWFDYSRRVVGLGTLVRVTGNEAEEIAGIRGLYHSGMARHPELFAEARDAPGQPAGKER